MCGALIFGPHNANILRYFYRHNKINKTSTATHKRYGKKTKKNKPELEVGGLQLCTFL